MLPIARKIKGYINSLRLIFSANVNFKDILSQSEGCTFGKYVKLTKTYEIYETKIGDFTYISRNSRIFNTRIGRFCSIGSNFISGNGIHPINGISTAPMFYSDLKQNGITLSTKSKIVEFLPVTIGNDVFIGDNVTVLSGINIGHGAVIGAGAVVSKDIPPYAVAVGCPIQVLKYRFSEDQISSLLRIQWWNLPEERLKEIEEKFFDVDEFINANNETINNNYQSQ
jgi:virginiamycin A acetyltransferase